jgi:hypothetical protein
VRAYFLFFLYASARTVTCGNGGGNNCGVQADFTHLDLFSVCFCLSVLLPEVKQSAH